jgi:hypothetical protein
VVDVDWQPLKRPRTRTITSSRLTGPGPGAIEYKPHYAFSDPTLTERDVAKFLEACLAWLTATLSEAERLTT